MAGEAAPADGALCRPCARLLLQEPGLLVRQTGLCKRNLALLITARTALFSHV